MSERDPRFQRKPNAQSRTFVSGYEQGSVASRMSKAEYREFQKWLRDKERDGHALERQLANGYF